MPDSVKPALKKGKNSDLSRDHFGMLLAVNGPLTSETANMSEFGSRSDGQKNTGEGHALYAVSLKIRQIGNFTRQDGEISLLQMGILPIGEPVTLVCCR